MSHRVFPLVVGLVAVVAGSRIAAGPPELGAGVQIQTAGMPLTVSWLSTPEVADWDDDGRKDLLVGQFTQGKISLFLNVGTEASPTLGPGSFVRAGGVDITVDYG